MFHRSVTVDLQVVYCLQIGGVDQMVDHLRVKYTFKKRDVFYFTKRVPKDLVSLSTVTYPILVTVIFTMKNINNIL